MTRTDEMDLIGTAEDGHGVQGVSAGRADTYGQRQDVETLRTAGTTHREDIVIVLSSRVLMRRG